MRIQKYLAHAGIASRRKAEDLVREGRVSVNGETAKIGRVIDPENDNIEFDGKPVNLKDDNAYYLLHKPTGYLSTTKDPKGRPTVLDLLPEEAKSTRIYPVGRLDYDSEGLILLTNDGDHAYRLTHPKFEVEKTYKVLAKGKIKAQEIAKLEKGVKLSDGKTAPAIVSIIEETTDDTWVKITIKEGRNRQVRRMFEKIKHPVIRLIRLSMGPYTLGPLKPKELVKIEKKELS